MAGSMKEMNQGISVLSDGIKQLTKSFGTLRDGIMKYFKGFFSRLLDLFRR